MLNKNWQKDIYQISTDKSRLDWQLIYNFLSKSYWANGRTFEQVSHSIEHSLCFGLYAETQQAGFARVITDYSTFAYLADVFILPDYQGKGLGKWLIETIFSVQELADVITWLLLTKDAHHLYKKVGFQSFPYPERLMVRKKGGIE